MTIEELKLLTEEELNKTSLTEGMKKYILTLKQYEGYCVIKKVGVFYEVYGDMAKKVAEILNIPLTKRGEFPMTGIAYHQLYNSIDKIEESGYNVVVIEK